MIDPKVVIEMSEEDLTKFFPKMGDRIAVRQFCHKEDSSELDLPTIRSTGTLKYKLSKQKCSDKRADCTKRYKLTGNRNAEKEIRRLEVGWRNFDGREYRQVRERKGGGTRHLKLSKSTTVEEIEGIAKALFFPDGTSKLGDLGDFVISIRDSTDTILTAGSTLAELYSKYKMKMLRLYLCTEKAEQQENVLESDVSPDTDVSRSPSAPSERSACRETDTSHSCMEDHEDKLPDLSIQQLPEEPDSPTITFHKSEYEQSGFLEDTLPLCSSTPNKIPKQLKLHRGHVFKDLNDAVKEGKLSADDITLEVVMILPNGNVEQGEDNGGILRDALSEYWDTFYKKATTGSTLKVPMIRHDMKETWECVAHIIVLGYKIVGYFPISIAKPFLEHCFGGKPDNETLLEAFLEFVPQHDKKIIEENPKDFSDEDFLDFLETHDVKTVVTEKNWHRVLYEIAHKELIQEPAYVSECWNRIFARHLQMNSTEIQDLISTLTPKPKKVISCLKFEDNLGPKEKCCAEFLKKFIRNSAGDLLKRFLRFCTGADILTCTNITVQFSIPMSEYARTPVGHTCGCVLDLPNTYQSALELSEEFTELLSSNVWVMDIV